MSRKSDLLGQGYNALINLVTRIIKLKTLLRSLVYLVHLLDFKRYVTSLNGFEPISIAGDDYSFLVRLINSGTAPRISSYFRLKGHTTASKNDQLTARRLQEMQIIEASEGKFFPGITNYRLTEKGIFHVLSKMEEYSPDLLIRYADSCVLETLIFQFFEQQTIKRCTARLYSEITRYLKECCTLSILRIESLKNSGNEDQSKERLRELEFDLMWLAKILVLELAMMYSEANILRLTANMTNDNAKVAVYELENDMKTLLSKDSKFKTILDSTHEELTEGYREISKRSE